MAQKTEECKCLVAVRVRGTVSAQREVRETLELLHLTHTNHGLLIDSRPAYLGMLQRVNNYVTWGEPTKEIVSKMLQKRAKLAGGKKLTDEYIQKAGYKSFDDLAEAIVTCKVAFQKLPDIQPDSDFIRQAKATKVKPRKASEQAAKQATAEKQ